MFIILMLNNVVCSYQIFLNNIIKREIIQSSYICKLSYTKNISECSLLSEFNKVINLYDDKIFIVHNKNKINVCYRGSYNIPDFLTNFNINNKNFMNEDIRIHSGYLNYYLKTKDEIIKQINEIRRKNKITDIIFTGHSLGGSVATIASFDSKNIFNDVNIKCITFGAPKVGNDKFIDEYNKKILYSYRFVNENDVFEHVPFILYKHPHKPIYLKAPSIYEYPHNISNYINNLHSFFELVK
jgi:predicted lipase